MRTGAIEISGVVKAFGGVRAVDLLGQTVRLEPGRISAILGGNGAGKTTLFNIINGILRPDVGNVKWDGKPLGSMPIWKRCRLGMERLWQDLRLFPNLTCLENVRVAIHDQRGEKLSTALALRAVVRREFIQCNVRAMECLEKVGLGEKADDLARNLSYGQQKLLGIARLLCNEPSVLLLDEPIGGLDVKMATYITELVRQMRRADRVIIIIEHDLRAIRDLVEHVVFLDHGRCVATGSLSDILDSADIRRRYMGIR